MSAFLGLTGAILGISTLILCYILYKILKLKNHVGLEKLSLFKKGLCAILVMFQTFLFMPALDIVLRMIEINYDISYGYKE
jgi:multisubunit Na+/H+ antiporter MnhB subunit